MKSFMGFTGVYVGHSTNIEAGTGCSALVFPEGVICGVDVRGGAPATRETDLLRPEKTIQKVHCVMLSGGSAFGLAAASGAARELEKRGIGVDVAVTKVPIVVSACVFDLACGSANIRPTEENGIEAVRDALDSDVVSLERGCTGAGTGCTVAKFGGLERAVKSGLGQGVFKQEDLIVAAISVVNAAGDILDRNTHELLAGVLTGDTTKPFISSLECVKEQTAQPLLKNTNTTITCVVTNAKLTQAEAQKVAEAAHDAYAHVISPTHTSIDGDAIFVAATGEVDKSVDLVSIGATEAIEKAINDAVREATSLFGYPAIRDL